MPIIVSIASGKGGVGKSVVASNLGLLLARHGKRVVLVDLDIGGANLHILFGQIQPSKSISDFISRKIESLDEVAQEVEWGSGLRLIPGTGQTLATANLPYAKKQRLMRHIKNLDADIVLLDCPPPVRVINHWISFCRVQPKWLSPILILPRLSNCTDS